MKRAFANIGFSMAIALILINLLPYSLVLPITIGLAILFIASLSLSKFRQAVTVPLCIGTALIACLLFILHYNSTVLPQLALDNQSVDAYFYIIDNPERVSDTYIYAVRTTELLRNNAPQSIKLCLKTDFLIDAQPYQLLKATLDLDSVGDTAFKSSGYWSDGVFLSARTTLVESTKMFVNTPLRWIYNLRLDSVKLLSKSIADDAGAVSVALTTGYRGLVSRSLRTMFSTAGASHIMAVSGFHLVVVVGGFLFVMRKLKVNNKISTALTIALAFVFICFAGYSKSIIRAGIMMIVMLVGNLFNRRADGLNSLGLAVFIICLNPFAVADIGAQLSVVSTLSLIVLLPKIRFYSSNRIVERIAGAVAVPFSVLVFTAPIMYLFFGYLNFASLLSNAFVTLFGSISLVLSFVTLISLKIGILSNALVWLTTLTNNCLIKIVSVFASMSGAMIDLDDIFGVALAGVLIIFAFVYLSGNLKQLKIAGVISSLIMIVVLIFSIIMSSNSAQLLVTQDGAVALAYKNKAYVYGADSNADYSPINTFINSHNARLDTIAVSYIEDCSLALVEANPCNTFITPYDNEASVQNSDFVKCSTNYSSSNDDVSFKCVKNDEMSYCVLGVKNVTIVTGYNIKADCDILIKNDYITDQKGKIDLSNGDVVYTIYNDSFKARRVDSWLK